MAAHSHDFEIVIPGKPQIVNSAMAKIVEGKIGQTYLSASRLECFLLCHYVRLPASQDPA